MIDHHLHTTASDGRLSPRALVAPATAAGITIMSVTDHDAVAGLGARHAGEAVGVELVNGIEITAATHRIGRVVTTYADAAADEVCALFGSSDHLEIAVNAGNASDRLNLSRGAAVTIRKK